MPGDSSKTWEQPYLKRLKDLEPFYIRAKNEPERMLIENALTLYAKIIPILRRIASRPPADGFHAGMALGGLLEAWGNANALLKWPSEIIAEYEQLKERIAYSDKMSHGSEE